MQESTAVDNWHRDLNADPIETLTRAVIGSVFLCPTDRKASECFASLAIKPDDFISFRGSAVWESMQAVIDRGQEINIINVEIELYRRGKSDAVGGAAWLGQCGLLVQNISTYEELADTAEGFAAQLTDAMIGKRLVNLFDELAVAARRNILSGRASLDEAMQKIAEFERSQKMNHDASITVGALVATEYEAMQERAAALEAGDLSLAITVPSGCAALDKATGGGLPIGVPVVFAARPGGGKSATLLAACDATNLAGLGVHAFSLEDSERMVAQRLMARNALLDTNKLRTFDLSIGEMERLADGVYQVGQREHWLMDFRARLSMRDIRRSVERHMIANNTKLVAIDYINVIGCDDPRIRHDRKLVIDRALEESSVMAKELNICIAFGAQLKRKDHGNDRRPVESDFAESDKLLQISKLTLGFYRGAYGGFDPVEGVDYEMGKIPPSIEEFEAMAQFIIIKQNGGETGMVPATWHGPTVRVW